MTATMRLTRLLCFFVFWTILTVGHFPLTAAMAAQGTPWQLLRQTTQYATYIDTGSIETTTNLTIRVKYKTVSKSAAYREFIQDIRLEEGLSVDGYDRFSYTLTQVEIDCAGMRHRILEAADYDKNGRALSKLLQKEEWKKTHPETTYAALATWVCDDSPLLGEPLDDEGKDG